MPPPAPPVVLPDAVEVQVLDLTNQGVRVNARLQLSGEPSWVVIDGATVEIVGWAGPWPVEEHWWGERSARFIRLQALLADGRAVLLVLSQGQWSIRVDFD
jgi:protein ImuB